MQPAGGRRPRPLIFISYARTDLEIALAFKTALEDFAEVFIDVGMPVGVEWAEKLEAALESADLFLVLLSANSVDRDMVIAEVETAWRRYKQHRKPLIAPVRLGWDANLQLPLRGYLWRFNTVDWRSAGDTAQVAKSIAELLGIDASPVAPAHAPELSKNLEQIFLDRGFETRAMEAARQDGITMVIKGPRQVGKTRLLDRMMWAAADEGKRVALVDFQYLDADALGNARALFTQFAEMFTYAVGLESKVRQFQREGLPHSRNCTDYVEKYLLKEIQGQIFLAIDEADRLIQPARASADSDVGFRADLFRMIRLWHQKRRLGTDTPWNRLNIALVTSTEPYLLIPDAGTSPFNVAQKYEFTPMDFTIAEVERVNAKYLYPIHDIGTFFELLRGHPALTQDGFFFVRSEQWTEAKLIQEATSDKGPFSSHLRFYMLQLHRVPELAAAFCRLVRYREQPSEDDATRLIGAGLVREEDGVKVPRCKLYADFFARRLKC